MPRVLIAPAPLAKLEGEFMRVMHATGLDIVYPRKNVQMTEADLLAELPGVRVTLAGSEPYTRKVIESMPELRVIARAGVGFDGVDVEAATERGIVVTFTPGANHDAVAEHTFMLMLNLAKNFLSQHTLIRGGKWPRQANLPLRGKTLGIVGLGRIGKAVALRGLSFGMKVITYEPMMLDSVFASQHSIESMELEPLMRQADYVSLHLPLSISCRQMINERSLSWMKPTAFLINTARGGLVNEADLYRALSTGKLAGAGLDVFDEEPPAADNPLLHLDNVMLTAHTAGVDLQSRDDMALFAAQAIAALARGEWPAHQVVNPEVQSRYHWE